MTGQLRFKAFLIWKGCCSNKVSTVNKQLPHGNDMGRGVINHWYEEQSMERF